MHPPVAPRRPHVHVRHGHERQDPWFWLRDRDDPEVIRHLEAENAFQERALAHLEEFRKSLFEEMLGRIQETDVSAPVPWGGYWYYRRTVEGKPYPIHCRRSGSIDGVEQVLLDVNALAEGHAYTSVHTVVVSPDHRFLAYAVDHSGREVYRVCFKDLETGALLDDALLDVGDDLTWAADGRTIFYTALDATLRPHRVYRHALGTSMSSDVLVFEETDDRFRLGCYRTRSERFLVLVSESARTTEAHVLPADEPSAALRCLQPRHTGMRYTVEHQADRFLILTNDADDPEGRHTDAAINKKLVTARLDETRKTGWQELVPHRADVEIEAVDAFSEHIVLTERCEGLRRLRILPVNGGEEHVISQPEPAYDLGLHLNPTYDTSVLRFLYSAPNRPSTVFAYDMASRERTPVKVEPVLGSFHPDDYVVERIFATAPDGTRIPMSLVSKKGLPRDGFTPWLLYGYGSYGITVDPTFSSGRLSLLDRGVGFAIAHVRGGGAMGKAWHETAKFKGKRHTFDDFVACAEHLIARGYTSPTHLAIMGGSAGGLLMGAVLNARPELFRAAVAQVPFVDVVTTMLDETLPLTANEWEEWGDPRQEDFYRYMLSYSPYDNVRDVKYPDLLVTSGLNDPRVQYWEPTKWVARIRDTVSASHRSVVLLKTHLGAGHQGKSGRYGALEDRAFEYAFLLDRLGLAPPG